METPDLLGCEARPGKLCFSKALQIIPMCCRGFEATLYFRLPPEGKGRKWVKLWDNHTHPQLSSFLVSSKQNKTKPKNERKLGFVCNLWKPIQAFLLNSNQIEFSSQVSESAFRKKQIPGMHAYWHYTAWNLCPCLKYKTEPQVFWATYFYCFVLWTCENLKTPASLIGHTPKAAGPHEFSKPITNGSSFL